VGDATSVPEELSPIAAVFSCFTLQQMPNPKEVLSSWTESLVPGGILTVCFWPSDAEDSGPWRRMLDLTVLSSQRTPPMVGCTNTKLGFINKKEWQMPNKLINMLCCYFNLNPR